MARKRAAAASADGGTSDSIDDLLAEWKRERPDLESWPFAIFGRVWRLTGNLLGDAERWLAPIGLTFESFSLIVTLRRSGAPYELNPTALYRESLLSSGAMTNRIDRVEAMGLVKRRPDPNDRRGTLVTLTPKGRKLADRAIKLHFEALAEEFAVLTASERKVLTSLLSKLLAGVETRRRGNGERKGR
ncbi:MAG TPA: MarR family transcriptional regulator [Pseudolabrys sp.]|nr:MarR family transcriptional regulator [Pseudolabrys sp.]